MGDADNIAMEWSFFLTGHGIGGTRAARWDGDRYGAKEEWEDEQRLLPYRCGEHNTGSLQHFHLFTPQLQPLTFVQLEWDNVGQQILNNLAMALKLQPSMIRTGRLYKYRAAGWNQVEKMLGDVPKRLSASKRNQNMRVGVLNLHNVRERELQGPKVIRHHSTVVSSGTIGQTTLVAFCILT